MSDYNSSLPVRTENNGDVVAKLVDGTITSQALAIDATGAISVKLEDGAGTALTSTLNGGAQSLDVNVSNTSLVVTATDLDIRDLSHTQDSVKIGDGTDFLAIEADGSINANVTIPGTTKIQIWDGTDTLAVNADGSINSVVTATDLDIRDLSHTQDSVKVGDGTDFLEVNSDGSVNVNIRDEAGAAFSSSNPLPVVMLESEGDEVNDFNTVASVAGGASSNHDYTVTAGKTLELTQVESSGSGKMKTEVKVETGVATGVFTTKFVQFNSTSSPNMSTMLKEPIAVAAGVRVRVVRTNRDNQAQDVYSTICGHEV